MSRLITICCFFLCLAISVNGEETIPHTFVPGQAISASQMNDNFLSLKSSLPQQLLDNNGDCILTGKWIVKNYISSQPDECSVGVVTFNEDGSLTIESGSVGWIVHCEDGNLRNPTDIKWEVKDGLFVKVSYSAELLRWDESLRTYVWINGNLSTSVIPIKIDKDRLLLSYDSPWGSESLSTLTRN